MIDVIRMVEFRVPLVSAVSAAICVVCLFAIIGCLAVELSKLRKENKLVRKMMCRNITAGFFAGGS